MADQAAVGPEQLAATRTRGHGVVDPTVLEQGYQCTTLRPANHHPRVWLASDGSAQPMLSRHACSGTSHATPSSWHSTLCQCGLRWQNSSPGRRPRTDRPTP